MEDHQDGSLDLLIMEAFSFLTGRGFKVSDASDTEVRFENDETGTFVRVFHDTRDKYLGYRVGLVTQPRDALTTAEIEHLTGHGDTPGLFPESADELPEAVKKLALRLEQRGGRALIGDLTIFDEARRLRSEHTARYTQRAD